MKGFVTLAVSFVLLSAGIGPARAQEPPGVIVAAAGLKPFPLSAEALGNTIANEAIDVRSQITAAVTGIQFEEGQWATKGQVLVALENAEQLADLAAARAALVDSTSQVRRSEELYKTNVVSASQLEQLRAQQEAHQAAVHAAESRLEQTVIRAPFAGRLGLRRVSLGSVINPDTVLTTLDDTSRIKLDFDVPEVFIARLEPGLNVTARSASWPGVPFSGQVSSVDTRVDPVTRTITVRAILPNDEGRLRPGMFLTVTLLKDDVQALMIPEEAIVPERSKQYVFVVGDNDVARIREIETGRRRPGEVEILRGLAEGERVITEGTQKARDGEPVTILSGSRQAGGR